MGDTSALSRITVYSFVTFFLAFYAAFCGCQNPPTDLLLTDPANTTGNVSRNCIIANVNDQCPDPNLHFYFYSGNNGESKEIDLNDVDWLTKSNFNPSLPVVMLAHGYRGGDSLMPMVVLKNAYIRRGEYNIITLDWGEYVRPPCYLQSVWSLKAVAKCSAYMLSFLENAGIDTERITCVGHSLGAQLCGLVSAVAPKKFDKIIGLDPAKPLFTFASPPDRLDEKDARVVQVIHTNAGFYGLNNMVGTSDFCVNKGAQPFCEKTRNEQLCSHAHAICFMAESLYPEKARTGVPCERNCPQPNHSPSLEGPVATMGQYMGDSAAGMYCVTAESAPYCAESEGDSSYGDIRCCPVHVSRRKGNENRDILEGDIMFDGD